MRRGEARLRRVFVVQTSRILQSGLSYNIGELDGITRDDRDSQCLYSAATGELLLSSLMIDIFQ